MVIMEVGIREAKNNLSKLVEAMRELRVGPGLEDTTQLGTGTLSNGIATFTTSSLTPGAHSVTAVYSGNNTFATSTSAAPLTNVAARRSLNR